MSDKPITMFGDGGTSRDYTFIDDIIDGIMSARAHTLKRPGYDVFNLGNSSPVRLTELISQLETAIGKKARVDGAPMQAGDVLRTYADIAHARHTRLQSPNRPH